MRILAAAAASCLAIACGSPPAPVSAAVPAPVTEPVTEPVSVAPPAPPRLPPRTIPPLSPAERETQRAAIAAQKAEADALIAAQGPWKAPDPARWKASTDGYVSFLWARRQLPLGARAVAFASYLNGMHNRVHPVFAGWIISSLERRPKDDPLNDARLVTRLEIVLDREGRIVRLGVSRTSDNAEFDLAALDSFDRARPFSAPPPEILSSDGHLYVSWEIHRDEVFACSTMNAHPFVLDPIR